jgi:hypothetical protein
MGCSGMAIRNEIPYQSDEVHGINQFRASNIGSVGKSETSGKKMAIIERQKSNKPALAIEMMAKTGLLPMLLISKGRAAIFASARGGSPLNRNIA